MNGVTEPKVPSESEVPVEPKVSLEPQVRVDSKVERLNQKSDSTATLGAKPLSAKSVEEGVDDVKTFVGAVEAFL